MREPLTLDDVIRWYAEVPGADDVVAHLKEIQSRSGDRIREPLALVTRERTEVFGADEVVARLREIFGRDELKTRWACERIAVAAGETISLILNCKLVNLDLELDHWASWLAVTRRLETLHRKDDRRSAFIAQAIARSVVHLSPEDLATAVETVSKFSKVADQTRRDLDDVRKLRANRKEAGEMTDIERLYGRNFAEDESQRRIEADVLWPVLFDIWDTLDLKLAKTPSVRLMDFIQYVHDCLDLEPAGKSTVARTLKEWIESDPHLYPRRMPPSEWVRTRHTPMWAYLHRSAPRSETALDPAPASTSC